MATTKNPSKTHSKAAASKKAPAKISASEKSGAKRAPQKLAAEKSAAKKAAPQKIASEKSAAKKVARNDLMEAVGATINPSTVFEVIVKRVLQERQSFLSSVNGTIMFVVAGENSGVWTLDMRRGVAAEVYPGRIDDPSVMVAIDQELLGGFVDGSLDTKQAVKDQQLGVSGDTKILTAFASALGAGSALDLRSSLARH